MQTLIVRGPGKYLQEYKYILSVILENFLGIDYVFKEHSKGTTEIRIQDDKTDKVLIIENILFNTPVANWLRKDSLPETPLAHWNVSNDLPEAKLCGKESPVIYGKKLQNDNFLEQNDNYIHLGLDIFGSSFFMLTRYEEMAIPIRDKHERFPAEASLSYKEGFLFRPIVNEYVEILWAAMKRLWPGLERREHSYNVLLTHDVDHPFVACDQNWCQIFRNVSGDLIKRKDTDLAIRRIKCKIKRNSALDPAYTFDFIMDLSEKYGIRSEFYFMTDHSAGILDGSNYSIESPVILSLIKRIYERGHVIGLHPSYTTFKDLERTRREFNKLLSAAESMGVKQESWGGRQHYLRWENPTTWQIWEDVGLNYDSTVYYAEQPGFRIGTCFDFPVFNLSTRKELKLKEKPLIAMDVTLLNENYSKQRPENIAGIIKDLSDRCRLFGGTFVLLWHNSSLLEGWEKDVYREIIKNIS